MKLSYVMVLALVAVVAADSFEHYQSDYSQEDPSNFYSRQSRPRRREGFVGSV